MKVLIRADGSEKIGAGHIMRCLALAQGLANRGHVVSFLCAETSTHFIEILKQSGFTTSLLNSMSGTTGDLKETLEYIQREQYDWLIVDSYAINKPYMQTIRQNGARLAVIDDIADREINADVIINQSLGAEKLQYKADSKTKMLLGLNYTMLRREYWDVSAKRKAAHPPQKILLSLGGSPPFIHLQKVFRSVLRVKPQAIELRVVLGVLPQEQQKCIQNDANELCSDISKIVFVPWVSSLYEELQNSDLFLAASGSSVFEALALRVPLLIGYFADNQQVIYSELVSRGFAQGFGDLRSNEADAVGSAFLTAINSPVRAEAENGFDGRGVLRIADELCNLLKSQH